MDIEKTAKSAKEAAVKLATLNSEKKNEALEAVALALEKNAQKIFDANSRDLKEAKGLSKSMLGRLKLDDNKMRDMIYGIRDIIKLEDPVNKILEKTKLDEDLTLYKVSCPIGVIGVIFESRPDVISQISALAIKSGNAVILKGGSEAKNTNKTISDIIIETLDKIEGYPKNAINMIYTREEAAKMLEMNKYIDLVIPRGSNALVKYIQENTKIPVLGHADGICHIYIDRFADKQKALDICVDAKVQYPSACNAVETLLIHKDVDFAPELITSLKKEEVEIDELPANWGVEYSDKKVSIRYVESLEEAIEHINTYGSGHTDCIITENEDNACKFMNLVDSAGVFHNVSTRFSDGFRYGFGAEVGISTNKTHARGPVGIEGLTIYKYKLVGNGQTVSDYVLGRKTFKHEKLEAK